MEKTEIVIGDFMVKHVDKLYWQLFERREIGESNNPNTKARVGEVDWMALLAFYGTLKPALVRLRAIYRERGLESAELSNAVRQLERLDADFEAKLGEALRKAVS